MSEGNDDNGSWGFMFLTVACAAAATAIARRLYALLTANTKPKETKNERWTKPAPGWLKLNVDGSYDEQKGHSAGCGGVVRDESGEWLLGFAQRLDPVTCQSNRTELEAILTGLELAWKMDRVQKLVVESDNKPAVSMVEKGVKPNHDDYDVVEDIRELCFDPNWEVRLVTISKKANRVADRLAKDARKLSAHNLREYLSPPNYNCTQLFLVDKGQSYRPVPGLWHGLCSHKICRIQRAGRSKLPSSQLDMASSVRLDDYRVFLEVRAKSPKEIIRVKVAFSIFWYLLSAFWGTLLMKYTGCCFSSLSWTIVVLTVSFATKI
ncbi:putative ribonuclease H protein, partial [Mucuna pruriens]